MVWRVSCAGEGKLVYRKMSGAKYRIIMKTCYSKTEVDQRVEEGFTFQQVNDSAGTNATTRCLDKNIYIILILNMHQAGFWEPLSNHKISIHRSPMTVSNP